MRILLIAANLRPESGWGTFSANTADGLLANGHEVLALVADGSTHPCPQKTGLPQAIRLLGSPLARLKTAWLTAKAIRSFRPDVIHVLVEPYALAFPLLKRIVGLPPWIMNLHGTYTILPLQKPSTRRLLTKAYEDCRAFVCCSAFTKGKTQSGVRTFCGDDAWNAMEPKITMFRFGMKPVEARHVAKNDGVKRVLFVGVLKENKGVLELIRAAAAYKRASKTPFRLDVVGRIYPDHPYVATLREAIKSEGLENEAFLRGHVSNEELDEAYASADLFMMLSRSEGAYYEGFGLVLLEAAARGIPVIGSTDAGCAEALKEGVTGYEADPCDAAGIADKMRKILDENAIDRNACEAWAREHTVARQTATFEEVYAKAVRNAAE